MREFLRENMERPVLLMTDGPGMRGYVHELGDDFVVLWNPKGWHRIPLDSIVGWSAQHRLERWRADFEGCTRSMTCGLHYPAA